MFKQTYLSAAIVALLSHPLAAAAATDADLHAIREQVEQLKQSYEQRISQLEQRLQQAEATSKQAESTATQAQMQAQAAVQQATPQPAAASSAGAFNPALSLILSGTYGNLTQNPAIFLFPKTWLVRIWQNFPRLGLIMGMPRARKVRNKKSVARSFAGNVWNKYATRRSLRWKPRHSPDK